MALMLSCSPIPQRPPVYNPSLRPAFEQCERDYDHCMQVDRLEVAEEIADDPMWQGVAVGHQPRCNRALKRCYERAKAKSAVDPLQ